MPEGRDRRLEKRLFEMPVAHIQRLEPAIIAFISEMTVSANLLHRRAYITALRRFSKTT